MATAYITLMMVLVHYLLDQDHTPNPVDRVIIDWVARVWKVLIKDQPETSYKWNKAIEDAVLMFSDQQLITGIGILVSGYTQIECSLSIYHWEMVAYLAWFSSLTHLTTLTAIRMFFRKQPTLAYWRVILMGCTIVLLAASLIPTGFVAEDSDFYWMGIPPLANPVLAVPVLCLFDPTKFQRAYRTFLNESSNQAVETLQPFNWLFIVASLLFLFISYTSRVISLFTPTARFAQYALRTMPGYKLKWLVFRIRGKSKGSKQLIARKAWAAISHLMMIIYVVLKVTFDLGQSMLWEASLGFTIPTQLKLIT